MALNAYGLATAFIVFVQPFYLAIGNTLSRPEYTAFKSYVLWQPSGIYVFRLFPGSQRYNSYRHHLRRTLVQYAPLAAISCQL